MTRETIDLSQAVQMVRWLDDEHRKDRQQIADLLKRIDGQTEMIVNLGRRLTELEGRLAATQNNIPRIDQLETNLDQMRTAQGRRLEELDVRITTAQNSLQRFDQVESSMQQVRTEASTLLPKFEHELQAALDQTAQTRALERERDGRAINEIRMLLEPIPEIQRRLNAMAAEDSRLNEQFPLLHSGIAKLAEALEPIPPRLQYLEEWGERLTIQISDLKLIEERLRTQHAQMQEEVRRSEEDLRQMLAQWSADSAEHRRQVDAALAALPPLDVVYEEARRVLKHYEGLEDEIRAEQVKVDQLLELSDQRLKETLAEWSSDHEKDWAQYVTMFDLYRKQQRETIDVMLLRLDALEQAGVEQAALWHDLRETWAEQAKRQLLELERAHQELQATVIGRKRKPVIQ
jgi:DNA repair exonuclease SbcCD ATPase subunit